MSSKVAKSESEKPAPIQWEEKEDLNTRLLSDLAERSVRSILKFKFIADITLRALEDYQEDRLDFANQEYPDLPFPFNAESLEALREVIASLPKKGFLAVEGAIASEEAVLVDAAEVSPDAQETAAYRQHINSPYARC